MNPIEFGDHSDLIPDVIEPIVGYRLLLIPNTFDVENFYLRSFLGTVWAPEEDVKASCYLQYLAPHDVPSSPLNFVLEESPYSDFILETESKHGIRIQSHVGYGCGIYAYKTLDECIKNGVYSLKLHRQQLVIAKVMLWGRVFEHEKGYRASNARIEEIFFFPRKGYFFFDHEKCKYKPEIVEQRIIQTYQVSTHHITKKQIKKNRLKSLRPTLKDLVNYMVHDAKILNLWAIMFALMIVKFIISGFIPNESIGETILDSIYYILIILALFRNDIPFYRNNIHKLMFFKKK